LEKEKISITYDKRNESSKFFISLENLIENNSGADWNYKSNKIIKDLYEGCLLSQMVESKDDDWVPNVNESFWYP
jgi:hypothetical protein